MQQFLGQISVQTQGKGLYEFTREVERWVRGHGDGDGLLTLFIRHTSASLTVQENADPDVIRDLEAYFSRLVPENDPIYIHTMEGPDDMPAHVRSALTQTHLSIPVSQGELTLGTWQGIYVFEHRRRPHRRTISLHLLSD
ncbi:MAG: secondary thiamine-phosphate synthase enzyme YjbQ [Acidobacteria bacterium]|nr:secondary thiamine-phosphate synthase enzyme YjbQ [Acidobacteriota bacterium]MDA1235377.1 secondary thiamine-phosphate synthase enzyme YjbQ [Acidobacteriota bacterium]